MKEYENIARKILSKINEDIRNYIDEFNKFMEEIPEKITRKFNDSDFKGSNSVPEEYINLEKKLIELIKKTSNSKIAAINGKMTYLASFIDENNELKRKNEKEIFPNSILLNDFDVVISDLQNILEQLNRYFPEIRIKIGEINSHIDSLREKNNTRKSENLFYYSVIISAISLLISIAASFYCYKLSSNDTDYQKSYIRNIIYEENKRFDNKLDSLIILVSLKSKVEELKKKKK